jgi:hypothetical protein
MRRQTKRPVFFVLTIVIFYLPSLQYAWILRTVPRNVNNHLPSPQQHPPFTISPLHGPAASAGSRCNHRCVFHDTTTTATNTKIRSVLWSLPPIVPVPEDDSDDDDDNDDENGERELVRAGRRNRRTATREVQGPNSSSNDKEHDLDTWENPAGRRVDQDDEDYLYDDDNEDDDDWMDENDMGTISYDLLLEDVIIPNPLLDSMDPDGAADRFPELIRDPKFWLDMVLFLAFLDFLSAAGPQSNPFPDLPWFY